jgi:hypothetical protein
MFINGVKGSDGHKIMQNICTYLNGFLARLLSPLISALYFGKLVMA